MDNATPAPRGSIEDVATGQRLVIIAILIYIVTLVLISAVDQVFGVLGFATVILAIVGLLQLGKGLGYSTGIKVLLVILVFVPIASLIMLLVVNGKATEALRAAGYKVGLMGARKP